MLSGRWSMRSIWGHIKLPSLSMANIIITSAGACKSLSGSSWSKKGNRLFTSKHKTGHLGET